MITICHTIEAMKDMVENGAVYSCNAPLGYHYYTTNKDNALMGIYRDEECLRPIDKKKLVFINEDTVWNKVLDKLPESYTEETKQRITPLDRRVDYVWNMKQETWEILVEDDLAYIVFKASVCVINDEYLYRFMMKNESETLIIHFKLPLDSKITDIKPALIEAIKLKKK